MNQKTPITNVSKYLCAVNDYVQEFSKEIVVYRGEDKLYDEPCKPNIFRKALLNKSENFEKNLLDTMRQNKLSGCESYLDNAIDAQHGEFPSRLLDVTYNCLVALYFAVTPYYHNDEDSNDNEDGQVYLFHFDKVCSPSAELTKDCYNDIITHKNGIISQNMLFRKKHIFIDHCKMNNRIIAQQGAFVLFLGDDAEPIPAYMFEGLLIPANSKKSIRKELNTLFGIHTGSIYPEIVNLANELSRKSKKISPVDYSIEGLLLEIQSQLEMELEYYYKKIVSAKGNARTDMARITEKVVYSYQLGILQLSDYIVYKGVENRIQIEKNIEKLITAYDSALEEFQLELQNLNISIIDFDKLMIKLGDHNE